MKNIILIFTNTNLEMIKITIFQQKNAFRTCFIAESTILSCKKCEFYFFELYFTRAKQMSAGRLSVRGLAFFSFRKRSI